jgi:hypothetical protein
VQVSFFGGKLGRNPLKAYHVFAAAITEFGTNAQAENGPNS